MFIRIESGSAVSIYRQIVDQVKYQIAAGTIKAGDRLPSVRELADRLPANQNTVLKAYNLLALENIIAIRQGEGTFVQDGLPSLKKAERLKKVASILASAAAQAFHFEITSAELHEQLDLEIKKLSPGNKPHE